MTEVIDLISSSPPRPKDTTSKASSSSKDVFNFDTDDFDITGDLEFAIEHPAKKRKLTPPSTHRVEVARQKKPKDPIFDLSSEPDDVALPTEPVLQSKDSITATTVPEVYDNSGLSFSSSAPEPLQTKSSSKLVVLDLSSDNEALPNDPISSSQPNEKVRPAFSERTANLLANVRTGSTKPSKSREVFKSGRTARATSADETRSERFQKAAKAIVDDIFDSSQAESSKKNASRSSKVNEDEKDAKASARAASRAARDNEKELEKQRKKLEKEEKILEKRKAADIAEVNKSKTNKKNSTPEMVIDMPSSLKGKSMANQVEEYMKQLEVELTYVNDEEIDLTSDTGVTHGSIIRWRRKVTAEYDEDNELWRPLLRPRVSTEDHILVFFKVEELLTLAVIGDSPLDINDTAKISESTMKANLDIHVATLRSRYPNCRPIYLIEGLNAWHKRSQNAKNRAYTAAVRAQALPDTTELGTTNSSRRKPAKPQQRTVDLSHLTEPTTESLLLHLQLHHQPLQIHHTTSPATSASQISSFTQHLSTRPYRLAQQNANLLSASFCMTTGQIRTGTTSGETWVNMLQEINRVTPSMAYGIVSAGYKNPSDLVRGFRNEGREMLQDVRKSVNKDGGWSDRRLGPMVSKRIHKVFMGRDPSARDGIA